MDCLNCGSEFNGRPNRVYCSARCKKQSEKKREKLKRLLVQIPALHAEAEAATLTGDYHRKRLSLAKADRAQAELERLSDQPVFHHTPNWLAPVRTCLARIEIHTHKGP